jgi:hypothetical protein
LAGKQVHSTSKRQRWISSKKDLTSKFISLLVALISGLTAAVPVLQEAVANPPNALRNPLRNSLPNPLRNPLPDPLPNPLRNPLPDPLPDPLRNPLPDPLGNPLPQPLRNPLPSPLQMPPE